MINLGKKFEEVKTKGIIRMIKKGIEKETGRSPKTLKMLFDRGKFGEDLLIKTTYETGKDTAVRKPFGENMFANQMKEYSEKYFSGLLSVDFENMKLDFLGKDKNGNKIK